jgi:hypothetical protein
LLRRRYFPEMRYSSSWRRRLLMEIMKDLEMEIALGEGDYSWGAGG